MKQLLVGVLVIFAIAACARRLPPSRLVYSSGFSFANYDYVVIAKPDAGSSSTSLYGLDVEFANLMTRNNMNVIGNKEFANLSPQNQKRSLFARLALSASGKIILLTVSFDDAVTGRTGASISAHAKGNIFHPTHRGNALEAVSTSVTKALAQDKGLRIVEQSATPAEVKEPEAPKDFERDAKLRQLKELRKLGRISDDEYDRKRASLLSPEPAAAPAP